MAETRDCRRVLRRQRIGAVSAVIAVLLALAGCGSAAPFVYDQAAYDREHPNFAKDPEFQGAVIVCYSKYGTKQSEIAKLAAQRCGRYGLGINFLGNTYRFCPMLTPVGAEFKCAGAVANIPEPQPTADSGVAPRRVSPGGTAGQPGAPLVGFQEGGRPMGVLFGRNKGAAPVNTFSEPPAEAPLKPGGQ